MGKSLSLVLLALTLTISSTSAATPAQKQLDSSIKRYINGEFAEAAEGLVEVFPFLTARENLRRAYRYLAYSYAMLGMNKRAEAVFCSALEVFPQMAIDTLEVPPRVGTVFYEAKINKKNEWHSRYKQVLIDRTIRKVSGVLLLTGAGATTWSSGYLLSNAQGTEGSNTASTWAGAGLGLASLVLLPVSVYLFVKSDNDRASPYVHLDSAPNGATLVLQF